MVDWEDLRFFSAFAHHGSITATAKALRVDHTTVSRRITSLETSLSVKLVDRRPRSYVLTDMGRDVANFAEDMSRSAFALSRCAGSGQNGIEGDIVVSAPPSLLYSFIAPQISALQSQHPDVRLRLVGTMEAMSLSKGEADIAISLKRPSEATLVARRLGQFSYFLYADPAYPTRNGPPLYISYDDTMRESDHYRWLDDRLSADEVFMCSNDLRIQAAAAAGGCGVALLPAYLAAEHGLVRFDPLDPGVRIDVWLVIHEDVRDTPRIRVAMDFISESLKPLWRS
ncbi:MULTISPECIES: LysR family transcriptional regulator [Rhizobium/Agrobacterium group]|uniref:LysR family transcriptional regulator n=1 Tax=Agrobacterium tomkonis CFBP 6623 TaxID=1183432 RepID=A0A1S7PGT1_9HYPH|nr:MULTISPECIES: LysR family transcriptional regulator [Rhizobium/Agrobacterium group]KRA63342.1 LysR family transcriptional regulator [Rhizobium sp. Root651]MCZ7455261.1 LysR family transcriptional regulator [Rhizobium rhizogenes]QCL88696.1 LysR family transcriptional regulator [Agrobacterium tumefaciens]TKT68242.1 LysR family transcriptional regulator [Agrobacterium sp. LC34]CUX20981.1 LysR family transcriptional regulator [Agrobacterium tomkonis CFBP 6623]